MISVRFVLFQMSGDHCSSTMELWNTSFEPKISYRGIELNRSIAIKCQLIVFAKIPPKKHEYKDLRNATHSTLVSNRHTLELYCWQSSDYRFSPLVCLFVCFLSRSFVMFPCIQIRNAVKAFKVISNDCRSSQIHHCHRYPTKHSKPPSIAPCFTLIWCVRYNFSNLHA